MTLKGIEHLGLVVADSLAMAEWYRDRLGFAILKTAASTNRRTAFIQCAATGAIIELITDKALMAIEDALSHPLQLHLAFKSDNFQDDLNRLLEAGAEFIKECPTDGPESKVCIIKDPWGNSIQLTQRRDSFYN